MSFLAGLLPMIGGAAGSVGVTAGGVGAGVAASGISLSSILQGTASLLGVFSSVAAANADAQALNDQALEADAQQTTENLQGIQRRASIKREMVQAIGQRDLAAAASGVDLSFGTAAQVRKEAIRTADVAGDTNSMTTYSRMVQLGQQADSLRRRARQTRGLGLINALAGGATALANNMGQ